MPGRSTGTSAAATSWCASTPIPTGSIAPTVFPGLWLDPAALLRKDLAGVLAVLERGLATPEHAAFVARLADAAAQHSNGG